MKSPTILRDWVFWVLLLGVIIFSVVRTQQSNDRVADVQTSMLRSQDCTQQFFGSTINALNERTTYTVQQANANQDLQQAQLKFITVLAAPDHTTAQGTAAFSDYFDALRHYNTLVQLGAGKADRFPYPRVEDYRACLRGGK